MDVRWDFMETSVTKVGFFKGKLLQFRLKLYITFLLYSLERNNPTKTVFQNDNGLSFVKYQDHL